MHLFFGDIEQEQAFLNPTESHHAARVMRMKPQDKILITTGNGKIFQAQLLEVHQKRSTAKILHEIPYQQSRNYHLTMAIAFTKNNDRMEWFAEKATEIGIDVIQPVITHHSERRNINVERLERIILAAVKQSLKAELPQVADPIDFTGFMQKSLQENSVKLIAHCSENTERRKITESIVLNHAHTILIGPEGDFSTEELVLANQHGYQSISMGHQRLRTETAALYAVMAVHHAHL